jgi:TonB-dependent receptor
MNDLLLKRRIASSRLLAALCVISSVVTPRVVFAEAAADTEEGADADADADAGSKEASSKPSKEQAPEESEDESAAELVDAEAELAAEEAAARAALQRPPAKGKGGIVGRVTDTKFSEAVVEAQVQVIGRKEKAVADVEGRFRLDLPPGKYNIRVSYELHRPSRIDSIVIQEGKLTPVSVQLVPDESAVEEVVIEESVDTASQEGLVMTRKNAAVAGDGVGRAEIARTPDKNAAEAAQRVVGATVIGGRYVYVRGLGERYTNALLNDAPLPSPEPDRNTVPLDLFPSLVLDSLTIVKQFTPDVPADFAGGSVRIKTRDFPKEALFQVSLNGGFDTHTTFQYRPGYYGSVSQWAGYDGGKRAFPPGIPNRRLSTSETQIQEKVGYGYRFNTPMSSLYKQSPFNHGLSVVAGNGYKLGKDTKLGYTAAFTYSRTYEIRDVVARTYKTSTIEDGSTAVLVKDDFKGQQGLDTVRWGAFGSASLELSKNHTLSLVGLHSQSSDDLTAEMLGRFDNTGLMHTSHFEYVSRTLDFIQLRGEHRFPKHKSLQINWHTSIAKAGRKQPDTRDLRYLKTERNGQPGWEFIPDGSGMHSWLEQDDTTYVGGLDIQQELYKATERDFKIKFGGLVTSRDRTFHARRFQLEPARVQGDLYKQASFCGGEEWSQQCPNQLFRNELVRPDGLLLDEWTLDFDQYETGLDVYAGYGMIDTMFLPKLRAVTGVRAEVTSQHFVGYDPFDKEGTAQSSEILHTDWLPALSLVYAATPKVNTRFGLTQTLARPQLRELSPTLFTSYAGDVAVQGNANLEMTRITNLDLRVEGFPTLREVLAFSVFYKHFQDPIEEVVTSNSILSFNNAESANLIGIELESRKTLEMISRQLREFTLIANLTLVYSRVDLGAKHGAATTDHRPLSYQSPYVVNLALDYDNDRSKTSFRVLYNVSGARIVAVGADGIPDTYQQPRHLLDASIAQKLGKHFEVKFLATNILGSPFVLALKDTQAFKASPVPGGGTRYESLGNNPVVRSWDPGTTFSLNATYNY